MPLDLDARAKKSTKLAITFDEETLNVEYCRWNITPRVQAELAEMPEAETYKLFLHLVTKWDLVKGGKTVPLKAPEILDVPSEILGRVIVRIYEDLRPPAEEKNSGGSF